MEKGNFKKKLKKIIICMVIILFIAIILLICMNYRMKKEEENDYEHDEEKYGTPIYIDDTKNTLYPENIYTIVYRYEGDVDLTDLYKSIYTFKTYLESLSELNNLVTEQEIKEFYNINVEYIREYTGIEDINNFKLLIEDSQKLSDANTFEKAIMDIDTLEIDNEKLTCQMDFMYSNDLTLTYKLTIYNSQYESYPFKYESVR